jgi:choline kinase
MLHSLALALAAQEGERRDAWVLSADTLYAEDALTRLWSIGPGRLAVAVAPAMAGNDPEIPVATAAGRVIAIGRDVLGGDGRMAHAVRWPAEHQEAVIAAADGGHRFQWQVLRELLHGPGAPDVLAVPVAEGEAFDIDDPADLDHARSRHRDALRQAG